MSLTAMVKRQAIQKRSTTRPPRRVTLMMSDGNQAEAAVVEEQEGEDERDPARNAIAVLAHYIPTEVIAVYVAALAAVSEIETKPDRLEEAFYFGGMGLVVLFVILAQAAERKTMTEAESQALSYPYWPCIAGVAAFAVWALAIPQAKPIFSLLDGYEPLIGVAAILSAFLLQMLEKALPDL